MTSSATSSTARYCSVRTRPGRPSGCRGGRRSRPSPGCGGWLRPTAGHGVRRGRPVCAAGSPAVHGTGRNRRFPLASFGRHRGSFVVPTIMQRRKQRGGVAAVGQADVVVRPAEELLDRLHFGLGRARHLGGFDQDHPLPRFGLGLLVVVEGEPVRKPQRPLRLAGQQPRPGRGLPKSPGGRPGRPSRRASSPGGRCGGPRPSARTSRPSARELRRTRPEAGRSRHPPSGPPRHPQRPGRRHRDVGGTLRGSTHTEA